MVVVIVFCHFCVHGDFFFRNENKIESYYQTECKYLDTRPRCPVGSPTHVKTRPEPEGFGVGSGQVRYFMIRVFSGRVPEGFYAFGFFSGIREKNKKTRTILRLSKEL